MPGPGCVERPPVEGEPLRFDGCDVRYRYQSGYTPTGALEFLVINEVVATQASILQDPTETGDCGAVDNGDDDDDDDPTNACRFDDFIELYNGSEETIDLAGLWLSDRRFDPQGWTFPEGASIGPGAYLLVWLDNDGGKCPRPEDDVPGDGQECPDPTNVATAAYHTSFSINGGGDQVYLLDTEANGFGVIHAVEFGLQTRDTSLALVPNGCRYGTFEVRSKSLVTPRAENQLATGECEPPVNENTFKRGDVNGDCSVDLSDPVYALGFLFGGLPDPLCFDAVDVNDTGTVDISDPIGELNFLFSGGPAPAPPGPQVPGVDPTPDTLPECGAAPCA